MFKKELKEFILNFSSGKISIEEKEFSKRIDCLLNETSPTERSIRNIKRILENDYYLSIYLEPFDYYLQYLEIIIKISAFSNYLTDIMVRNPEFLTRFLSSGELHKNLTYHDFKTELEQHISIYKTYEKKFDAIRRFKRLHLLRIGLRDILNLCDLEHTMFEFSILTQLILDKTFSLSFEIQKSNSRLKKIPDYALISLGKLGGLELNFSSDVDLICVYDNPDDKLSSHYLEFYDKVVKNFIQICTDLKDGSPLYRIDFRLRPDGKYSPLARSISYYQIYYETYGRDWERQMLLKMNFVSGNKILFDEFRKSIESFIFPRSFLIPPQIFIQRFRNIYLDSLKETTQLEKINLKHFKGGIRDVEFSIQALQLLHGGKFRNLRTQNTIEAIKNLEELNFITKHNASELIEAYKFLRRIENFIQLMDDRQLHSIPQDEDKFLNLIKYLRLKNSTEFNQKLKAVRKIITDFSERVFEFNSIKTNKKFYPKIKIEDHEILEQKFQHIINLLTQLEKKYLFTIGEYDFENFRSILFRYLSRCSTPEQVIKNLYRFISNLYSSFQVLELLRNEKLLKTLVEVFDISDYFSQILISDKKIIEALFSGRLLTKLTFENLDYSEDEIRFTIFHLMFNFLFKNLNEVEIGYLISNYLDSLIKNLIHHNLRKFNLSINDFALIALGSYGTREMHFKSDLDLLFLFSNEIEQNQAEKFSIKLLSDIREKFKLFDFFQADSKLRPEGKASKLNWTLEELHNYMRNRMRVWEFQSYTKMRLIEGNNIIIDQLVNLLHHRIRSIDKNLILYEIKRNRINMKSEKVSALGSSLDLKNSNGGLMDLQFLLQYKILSKNFDKKYLGKTLPETLNLFAKKENTLKLNQKNLKANYKMLLKMILIQQILTGKRGFLIDKNYDSKFVKKTFRIDISNSIFDHFKRILNENFEIIQKISPEIF